MVLGAEPLFATKNVVSNGLAFMHVATLDATEHFAPLDSPLSS
jgi:hypothetical protein